MRRLLVVPLGLALLAGCGSDPADARREHVAALTEAANARDADAVRAGADALAATVERQRERDEVTGDEAERLLALAAAVRRGADVVDADLLERRRAEAETEAARRQLEQTQQQLEEERKKAEEAAERERGDEEGKGKGKDDKDEDDD